MKIVFYSTNSNFYNGKNFHIKNIPSCANQLEQLAQKYIEDEFFVVTQFPGMFLLDLEDNTLKEKSSKIKYFITNKDSARDISNEIAELSPDLVISVTYWVTPFDWLGVKDAIIAQYLEEIGIKTRCNTVDFELNCFEKWHTHEILKEQFNVANGVFLNHDLYWAERNNHEIKNNIYKECLLEKISKLHFPIVIKDNFGLSSYGLEVVNTFAQAKAFLNSKKNNSDKVIEEFIEGAQFGIELCGIDDEYIIFDPFMFSVNKYGITSPKQSVKIGPVSDEKYKINSLKEKLLYFARKNKIQGIIQIDLVFDGEKWFIIEINPRVSGMSNTTACSNDMNLIELLYKPKKNVSKLVIDIKFPILEDEQLEKLSKFPNVIYISQTKNDDAKQIRESGFCEVIFGGRETFLELDNDLESLKKEFQDIIELSFYEKAKEMLKKLNHSSI